MYQVDETLLIDEAFLARPHVRFDLLCDTDLDLPQIGSHLARVTSTSCIKKMQREDLRLTLERSNRFDIANEREVHIFVPTENISGSIQDLLHSIQIDINPEIYQNIIVTNISFFGETKFKPFAKNTQIRSGLAVVVKPSIGLALDEYLDRAFAAFEGGADIVKDDENLIATDKKLPVVQRVKAIAHRAATYSWKKRRIFLINCSGETSLDEIGELAKNYSNSQVTFGVLMSFYSGFSLLHLVSRKFDFPVVCHSTGIGHLTTSSFSYSNRMIVKLLRLAGVDALVHSAPMSRGWYCNDAQATELLEASIEPFADTNPLTVYWGGGVNFSNADNIWRTYGSEHSGILVGGAIMDDQRGVLAAASAMKRIQSTK